MSDIALIIGPPLYETFDQHSWKLISFAEKAKTIWEDTNIIDVVIEPVGPFWYEISQIWSNKKFISIILDIQWNKLWWRVKI